MNHNNNLQMIGAGRQDCSDMHSFGPGMRNCYIIHYVIRGSGTFAVNQHTYQIAEGESFLIVPYTTIHYYPNKDAPWEYIWIEFSGEYVSERLHELGISMNHPVFPAMTKEEILLYFERAKKIAFDQTKKREAIGLVEAILGCIGDRISHMKDSLTENDERIAKAITYMEANYHSEDFSVEKLCKMMSLSRTTLYRLFKESVGMSPLDYLIHYRMEQAKRMLQNKASVKSTALSCGFSDPLYFSRQFHHMVGIRPSDYTDGIPEGVTV